MFRFLLPILFCLGCPLAAQSLRVVTDVAPVQSLVARVMEGVGAPLLLIPPGASPHDYAMRPSEARALVQADLVVWIGPQLTGWLEGPLNTLGAGAINLSLLDVADTVLLDLRNGVAFEAQDGNHSHDHGHDHDHAAHQDRVPLDPHAWLDPRNGATWSLALAEQLAELDPQNATRYRENAAAAAAELSVLEAELREDLAPYAGEPFVVLHDAFYYYEARFGIQAMAAVVGSDASAPGPARLSDLRARLEATPVTCAFAEPQTSTALLNTVTEGQDVRIVTLNPMGDETVALPRRYVESLRSIAATMAACFSAE